MASLANNGINIILQRYAEVLLNYAEAKIEAAASDQSVYDVINNVRNKRTGVFDPAKHCLCSLPKNQSDQDANLDQHP